MTDKERAALRSGETCSDCGGSRTIDCKMWADNDTEEMVATFKQPCPKCSDETTPTPEEDQACMGALRVVRLLENAKGIRRNVGIAEALEQARLNLAALAQRTGWRQPE